MTVLYRYSPCCSRKHAVTLTPFLISYLKIPTAEYSWHHRRVLLILALSPCGFAGVWKNAVSRNPALVLNSSQHQQQISFPSLFCASYNRESEEQHNDADLMRNTSGTQALLVVLNQIKMYWAS